MHRRLHVIAVLLFDLRSLTFLATAFLSGHSFQLVICKSQELLYEDARQKDLALGDHLIQIELLSAPSANRKCSAVGFPLHANPAHFLSE